MKDLLDLQLKILKDDEAKTRDRMAQIIGAIKVVEYLIEESGKQVEKPE